MSNQTALNYNQNDIDLTRYLLVLIKEYKTLIFFGIIALLINFIVQLNLVKIYSAELEVKENDTIKFLLSPKAFEALDQMEFTPEVFFKIQRNNFLNYKLFLDTYDNLDNSTKNSIPPEIMFDSIDYEDKNSDISKVGSYTFTSRFEDQKNVDILSQLVINSELSTFNNLLNNLEKKKYDTEIDIQNFKKQLIYNLNLDNEHEKLKLEKNIEDLSINLAIADQMGYIDPVIDQLYENEYLIQISEDEDRKTSESIQNQIINRKDIYFQGTKILGEQIAQLEKKLSENEKIGYSDSDSVEELIIRSKDYEKNTIKYNEFLTFMFQIENIINEVNILKENRKTTSVLTSYNLERIAIKDIRMNILYTYILSIIFGIGFGVIFVVVQDNIRARTLSENITSKELLP
tara:strand:+ start:7174 stop:8382 length:1209 start_codon:yes stop_codon:yes gene_type:complete